MAASVAFVDAFTGRQFQGNPAGVCILEEAADAAWMQAVAADLGLSETAFLHPGDSGWPLRWFTPTVEIELCGHATLASAHRIWETGLAALDSTLSFFTASGTLKASRRGSDIWISLPIDPPESCEAPEGLRSALGAGPVAVSRCRLGLLAELADDAAVRSLEPDFDAVEALPGDGVIVTATSEGGSGFDFISRFFAPSLGIPEDPVTGAAHCVLGPYWGPRMGKERLTGHQASPRGGIVEVQLAGDRVDLGGTAVTGRTQALDPGPGRSRP